MVKEAAKEILMFCDGFIDNCVNGIFASMSTRRISRTLVS
jgi:hypothetical protein